MIVQLGLFLKGRSKHWCSGCSLLANLFARIAWRQLNPRFRWHLFFVNPHGFWVTYNALNFLAAQGVLRFYDSRICLCYLLWYRHLASWWFWGFCLSPLSKAQSPAHEVLADFVLDDKCLITLFLYWWIFLLLHFLVIFLALFSHVVVLSSIEVSWPLHVLSVLCLACCSHRYFALVVPLLFCLGVCCWACGCTSYLLLVCLALLL